jgi:hypothetical protein
MNKNQIDNIIDYLESIYTQDKIYNKSTKNYINIVCPWEYAPILEWKLTSILNALRILHPEITELLEYYFFESKNMKKWWMIESDGKKYNYSNKEDVIKSMIDFWYIE